MLSVATGGTASVASVVPVVSVASVVSVVTVVSAVFPFAPACAFGAGCVRAGVVVASTFGVFARERGCGCPCGVWAVLTVACEFCFAPRAGVAGRAAGVAEVP